MQKFCKKLHFINPDDTFELNHTLTTWEAKHLNTNIDEKINIHEQDWFSYLDQLKINSWTPAPNTLEREKIPSYLKDISQKLVGIDLTNLIQQAIANNFIISKQINGKTFVKKINHVIPPMENRDQKKLKIIFEKYFSKIEQERKNNSLENSKIPKYNFLELTSEEQVLMMKTSIQKKSKK